MNKHAKLSPSSAARWLTCTAAPSLEGQFKDETSVYAEEGTLAHSLAELETAFALEKINKSVHTRRLNLLKTHNYFTQEMLDCAENYAEYVKENLFERRKFCADAFVDLETRLDLTEYVPEGFGTADCIIVSDVALHVVDFKYGKGVKVDAKNNEQMKLYALGAYLKYGDLYEFDSVNMTIFQPRLNNISSFEILVDDLINWAEYTVKPKAKEAFEGPGIPQPSEKACRFCKAQGECKARAEMFIELFEENQDPELLSAEEAGEILLKAKDLKNWLSAIESVVFSAIANGEQVSSWKIVEGKSNRKYVDEDKVADALLKEGYDAEKIYTKKLITITALEKALGKKKVAEIIGDLIIKPEGKPTLAEINDIRPAICVSEAIINAFDD